MTSRIKGNQPERWDELLSFLDEKLQFGLLEQLRRARSYHFEENELLVEAGSEQDFLYLSRPTVVQQLQLLAHDAVKVESVEVTRPAS